MPRDSADHFVNPYSFVPLPSVVRREPAPTQDRLHDGCLSGRITVKFTASTPVSIGGDVLRGSSVHGAVRSLYEALTASCFRVLNADFAPAYREPVVAGTRSWGVVTAVSDSDQGPRVEVTPAVAAEDVVLLSARTLLQLAENEVGKVRTGARLRIPGLSRTTLKPRGLTPRVSDAELFAFDDNGEYYLLVTDLVTRDPNKPMWFKAVRPSGRPVVLAESVIDDYERAAAGTKDRRVRDHGGWVAVSDARGKKWGERRTAHDLVVGQPVRIDFGGEGSIQRIALSEFWRRPVAAPVSSKLGKPVDSGESVAPCTDWRNVCPACSLFGSADTTGDHKQDRGAQQLSVRGRVIFTDPTVTHDAGRTAMGLVLSSPRPGAGQFYLTPTSGPAFEHDWSARDGRRLRGRKMYWTSSWSRRSKQKDDAPENDKVASQVEAFNEGTVWNATVIFEGLTEPEVGGLLVALSPSFMWTDKARLRLGGGKPYGLGSVNSEIDAIELEGLSATWLGEGTPTRLEGPAAREQAAAYVAAFTARAPEEARAAWPAMERLLTEDAVDPDLVSYPIDRAGTDPWPFFKQWTMAHPPAGLRSLPLVVEPDQTLRKP